MKNQVQLITYVDRLGGGDLAALQALLADPGAPLAGVFGGVHLLPFFTPIDGADAGFDPSDHLQVDPRLGDWSHIRALTGQLDVMADVIVNHMSADSPQFIDYSRHGAASRFAGLFLTMDAVFPQGATEADLLAIYRPRPGLPFTAVTLANGERRLLWTTFTAQQVDIDVAHPQGQAYLGAILDTLAAAGIRMVRLDAVGYAIKKAGASCFMMAETFAFIDAFAAQARSRGVEVLVEIHDELELDAALAAQARIVGVNQRDLVTFQVDHARALRMAGVIPNELVKVAESGVRGGDDARDLQAAGYHAVLVGETLVTSPDPTATLRELRGTVATECS